MFRPDPEPEAENVITAKQKLCMFHGTELSPIEVLKLTNEDINLDLLKKYNVTATNLIAAGVGPSMLLGFGAVKAGDLCDLGFDALHLVDTRFVHEAMRCYGAAEVTQRFLNSAAAAVAVAGTAAQRVLSVDASLLLSLCIGAPVEAESVLAQLPAEGLQGVPASILLDTGLRAGALSRYGYSPVLLQKCTGASARQMHTLGFQGYAR